MSGLAGKRVVVTRAPHQAAEMDALLLMHGAEPVPYPCIEIAPPEDCTELDAALREAAGGEYDWLVLTSANTVMILQQRLQVLGTTLPDALKVSSIGPSTAQSAESLLGIRTSLIPEKFVAEALAEALTLEPGTRILLPQSEQARPVLAESLMAGGAAVKATRAYRTLPGSGGADVPGLLVRKAIDAITFTSASTAHNFAARLKHEGHSLEVCDGVCIACIGPITTQAAQDIGLRVDVMPEAHTLEGLVDALAAFYTG